MMSQPPQIVQIGLAGFGNVGAGVYKNLLRNRELLRQRTGAELRVARVAVRDITKDRGEAPCDLFTARWQELVADPNIQIIIELIGGLIDAFDLVKAALHARKIVITGNKALLAEHGKEIFALAEEVGVPVYFEAAVAGGIPIIKAVQESLVGNRILAIYGILNGTCNYILTRMRRAGLSYQEALMEAQDLGYAEADPALDVSGWDAAHKAIVLASLSYGFWIRPDDVLVEGVDTVQPLELHFAKELGYVIKLISVVRVDEKNQVEVRTQPSMIPEGHVLASVNDVFNAVCVQGDIAGETLYYGRGAGQDPTSSSVISDLADAAFILANGCSHSGFAPHGLYGKSKPVDETVSRYYLRLTVDDRPGVLGRIATLLGEKSIGISKVIQVEDKVPFATLLVMVLHEAPYGIMLSALGEMEVMDCVNGKPVLLRLETLEG